jgi:hypothetical protein
MTPEQIEALKAEIIKDLDAKLEALKDQPAYKRPWYEPKDFQDYWFTTHYGTMGCANTIPSQATDILARQEVFATKEEAEVADRWRIALTSCKRWIAQNCEPAPVWEDTSEDKWRVHYNHRNKRFDTSDWRDGQSCPLGFDFATMEDATRFITECENDLRVLWNVKK